MTWAFCDSKVGHLIAHLDVVREIKRLPGNVHVAVDGLCPQSERSTTNARSNADDE